MEGVGGWDRQPNVEHQIPGSHLFENPTVLIFPIRGAVVQPGLGRQIVNLEVAGSNPVGPAIFPLICAIADPVIGLQSKEETL